MNIIDAKNQIPDRNQISECIFVSQLVWNQVFRVFFSPLVLSVSSLSLDAKSCHFASQCVWMLKHFFRWFTEYSCGQVLHVQSHVASIRTRRRNRRKWIGNYCILTECIHGGTDAVRALVFRFTWGVIPKPGFNTTSFYFPSIRSDGNYDVTCRDTWKNWGEAENFFLYLCLGKSGQKN